MSIQAKVALKDYIQLLLTYSQDKVTLKTKITNTVKVKGQSWGFTSRSTARVILGQVLRIATCGTRTHRGDSL